MQKLSTTDEQKPAPATIVAVLLTLLLEHGLRLLWCESNQRPLDRVARPHHFYVTLDGHGQRHKHDVILHPYVGGGAARAAAKTTVRSTKIDWSRNWVAAPWPC